MGNNRLRRIGPRNSSRYVTFIHTQEGTRDPEMSRPKVASVAIAPFLNSNSGAPEPLRTLIETSNK